MINWWKCVYNADRLHRLVGDCLPRILMVLFGLCGVALISVLVTCAYHTQIRFQKNIRPFVWVSTVHAHTKAYIRCYCYVVFVVAFILFCVLCIDWNSIPWEPFFLCFLTFSRVNANWSTLSCSTLQLLSTTTYIMSSATNVCNW